MDAVFEEFVAYLRYERAYSELTVVSYSSSLKAFELYFKSLDEEMSWETVTSDVVRSWMVCLLDSGLTASGVCPKLSAVKSFYRFMLGRGLVAVDPAHGVNAPKKSKPLPYFVREADMDCLLDDLEFPDSFAGRRDKTIISMLYSTGMRAAEILGLDLADVDLRNAMVSVVGKRNKQRLIPLHPELLRELEDYMLARETVLGGKPEDSALFIEERSGKRIAYPKLRVIVRDALSRVTIQSKRSPHVLRHSFATSMLNNFADLQSVKELLGHSSLKTTAIYANTTFEELKKLYNQAHPRA
ncbi:MAG: tyrosine-type recombinase/integrase [Bacteroidaceae bacterium]|nr:tyrosine-type recombinase/integrase [Bacteroidaceae bacterium]